MAKTIAMPRPEKRKYFVYLRVIAIKIELPYAILVLLQTYSKRSKQLEIEQ